jgi:hypothetical protein
VGRDVNGQRKQRRTRRIEVSSGPGSDEPRYTHLAAWVTEEEDGYIVRVRLHHETKPANAAWGEEISDSLQTASALLHALAEKFSIPQSRVTIRLRLENLRDGTRH